MADLNEAFERYFPPTQYKSGPEYPKGTVFGYVWQCVHCGSKDVTAITNDGGSLQNCNKCGKTYGARRLPPVKKSAEKNCQCASCR
jgi:hypothetical protein